MSMLARVNATTGFAVNLGARFTGHQWDADIVWQLLSMGRKEPMEVLAIEGDSSEFLKLRALRAKRLLSSQPARVHLVNQFAS